MSLPSELAPLSPIRTLLVLNAPVHTVQVVQKAKYEPLPVTPVQLTTQSIHAYLYPKYPNRQPSINLRIPLSQLSQLSQPPHATIPRISPSPMSQLSSLTNLRKLLSQMSQSLTSNQPAKFPVPNVPIANPQPISAYLYPNYLNYPNLDDFTKLCYTALQHTRAM